MSKFICLTKIADSVYSLTQPITTAIVREITHDMHNTLPEKYVWVGSNWASIRMYPTTEFGRACYAYQVTYRVNGILTRFDTNDIKRACTMFNTFFFGKPVDAGDLFLKIIKRETRMCRVVAVSKNRYLIEYEAGDGRKATSWRVGTMLGVRLYYNLNDVMEFPQGN